MRVERGQGDGSGSSGGNGSTGVAQQQQPGGTTIYTIQQLDPNST